MRVVIALAVLLALGLAVAFWTLGGERLVLAWSLEGQRAAQGGMGRALAALRAGDPAAVVPLLSICFLYGFFHAVGPGHGKLLIGSYGAARDVGAVRLSAVALASSLAQGATAIALVGAGVWVLDWSREYMTGLAERLLQPLGFAAIAALGLWLAFRGVRGLVRAGGADGAPGQHHHHDGGHGSSCGHAHVPSAERVAAATSLRELLVLVGAVAIRPCTGAIFLLILTAQMGAFVWGVAGTLVMALGTASVTIAVALAAVLLRQGAVAGLSDGAARAARVQPALEIAVGLALAWIATGPALATW